MPTLLTLRELQIAACVAEELTDKEIARRLGITEPTVKTHLRLIRERLGVRSRVGVAAWFIASDSGEW